MEKIKYEDIEKDKSDLIYIISIMMNVYQIHKHHNQVLECEQWLKMLYREPISIEYTPDALIALKNIMNDSVNYLISVEGRWDEGKSAMNLMNKIFKLFSRK